MNDNIWFTYKARICAQERLGRNDFYTQTLMVWYALVGAVLGITTLRYPTVLGSDTDLIAAVFSVALLAISMLVANRDFRGRSIEMRLNYLALQALYNKVCAEPGAMPQAEIDDKYQHLLSTVENHAEIDDKYFRVFHTGKLSSRHPTTREYAQVYAYLAIRVITLITLYSLPVLFVVCYR